MTTLRIVQFENGKYAVQQWGFIKWEYLGVKDNYVWRCVESIMKYCMMNSLNEAEESLEYIKADILSSRVRVKLPKVVKIIKKVRV